MHFGGSPCLYLFRLFATRWRLLQSKTLQSRIIEFHLGLSIGIGWFSRKTSVLHSELNLLNLFLLFSLDSYAYSNEVGNYGSPYGYSQSVATPQTMGYDISADYVDSTTTYEPRSTTIIDTDFIGGHSKYHPPYCGVSNI